MRIAATNYASIPIIEQPQGSKATLKPPKIIEATPRETRNHALVKELLLPLDELIIQAEVETIEPHHFLESERQQLRHYYIHNNRGEQFLSAFVESVFCIRVGFGIEPHPQHGEQLLRLHPTNIKNDVLHLFRSLTCDGCCFPCSLQLLEVFAPTKMLSGSVEQRCDILNAVYTVKNCGGDVMLRVQGYQMKQHMFRIFTHEKIEVGIIRRKDICYMKEGSTVAKKAWFLYMNGRIPEDIKMLLLAASIFIDLMFAEAPTIIRGE